MAAVHEQAEFAAEVEKVWEVVGDFAGLLSAMGMPAEVTGEGVGQTRTITLGDSPTVERLEERDAEAKRLVYSIVSSPLPVSDYRSTMQLSPASPGRTRLDWSATFEPASGTDEAGAAAVVSSIYQGGIQALQARFGS